MSIELKDQDCNACVPGLAFPASVLDPTTFTVPVSFLPLYLSLLFYTTQQLLVDSTAELKLLISEGYQRVIDSQKAELDALTVKTETQTEMLLFLQEKEQARHEASAALRARKERKKLEKKQAVRDGATLPEFLEAIKIIDNKKYRSPFKRSREKVSLLVLFLTGIRVANLLEITASNLRTLLSDDNMVYFEVNSIKSRQRLVYRVLLTQLSLQIAREYEEAILVLLKDKEPSDYIFTRKNNKTPLERASLTKRLNLIIKASGKVFGKNLRSHSFRVGHVTALIDQFGLLHAQRLIGHQNPETTLRYARNKLGSHDFCSKMVKVDQQKHLKIPRRKRSTQKQFKME